MAAPVYTTDLTDITDCDSGTFFEFTGYTAGTLQGVPETDYFIQDGSGSGGSVSSTCKTTLNSIGFDNGSGVTIPTDGAVLFWMTCWVPNSMGTYASGGQRAFIGDSASVFYGWKVGGSDRSPNPYGGWQNVAVNPTETADYTAGSPSVWQCFGVGLYLPSTYPTKGAMFGMDAVRYGRCESQFTYGDGTSGYATFAGFAATNDDLRYRWGLIQAISGGYLYKGKMSLGTSSTAVAFVDSNVLILIDDTPKATASFNTIEVNHADSVVYWTNVQVKALGTHSPGRVIVNNLATIYWDQCQFDGLNTFSFSANCEVTNCQFRNCGIITAGTGKFTGSSISGFEGSANSSAFVWNGAVDPGGTGGEMDGMSFTKGTAATHAITFGTSVPTTLHLNNIAFSGYNATTGQNDSAIYVTDTGGTYNIYLSGCTGNISYKSNGATVNLIIDPVTTTITVKDINTGSVLQYARVLLVASDATGALPYQESVTSITRSGSTATVTHSSHGMATGDFSLIAGANEEEYNGCFEITVTGTNTYTYTVPGTPNSPATGTIIATGGIFNTQTNASGQVTDSRSITSDQPVVGRVRLSTGSTLYKSSPISETIDSETGLLATVYLIPDS